MTPLTKYRTAGVLRGESPEVRLIGTLIVDALEEAEAGDAVAYYWIRECAWQWLALVAREHDEHELARWITDTLPVPDVNLGDVLDSIQLGREPPMILFRQMTLFDALEAA